MAINVPKIANDRIEPKWWKNTSLSILITLSYNIGGKRTIKKKYENPYLSKPAILIISTTNKTAPANIPMKVVIVVG